MGKLTYQNWLIEQTRPDCGVDLVGGPGAPRPNRRVRAAVRQALGQLESDERRFIEWVFFMGRTYRELSERTGRPLHRLEALRLRAFRKLRTALQPFVAREFGLRPESTRRCPICDSADRGMIDAIIRRRDRTRTWRPVLHEIRERCGQTIRSPWLLITHEKYHMIDTVALPSESDRSGCVQSLEKGGSHNDATE